jgi:hypothetical protein
MNKSIVEWFANRISHGGLVSKKQFNELLEQAKEMEKEQIMNAWDNSTNSGDYRSGKEYYDETFKQQEQ